MKIEPLKSLYDMSFCLFFIFLIISVSYLNKTHILNKQIDELNRKKKFQALIKEEALFNLGEYTFRNYDSAKVIIQKAIDSVFKLVQEDTIFKHRKVKSIIITGHTDNTRIGPQLAKKVPSNWELSFLRAMAVVNCIKMNNLLQDKKGLYEYQIFPSGRADNFPHPQNVIEFLKNEGICSNLDSISQDSLYVIVQNICESPEKYEMMKEFCNSDSLKKRLNRRIEIKLEF